MVKLDVFIYSTLNKNGWEKLSLTCFIWKKQFSSLSTMYKLQCFCTSVWWAVCKHVKWLLSWKVKSQILTEPLARTRDALSCCCSCTSLYLNLECNALRVTLVNIVSYCQHSLLFLTLNIEPELLFSMSEFLFGRCELLRWPSR